MAAPKTRRSLADTPKKWASFDRRKLDPMDAGQVGNVAALLRVNPARVHEAIRAAGTRCGAVRKWLAENAPKKRQP